MDFQSILNIVLGSILAIIGWFARQLWDAVQDLKEDMKKIEVDLPTHYVRKEDLENRLDRFENMLGKIYDKLDSKVDK